MSDRLIALESLIQGEYSFYSEVDDIDKENECIFATSTLFYNDPTIPLHTEVFSINSSIILSISTAFVTSLWAARIPRLFDQTCHMVDLR